MTGRARRRLVALAIATAAIAAGPASAQSPDTLPQGTLALGPVRITPSFLLKDMGVDENVFNTAQDPRRDFTLTAAPRADVKLRIRRLDLSYLTTSDYVYYRTYRAEGGTNVSSTARIGVDLGRLKPYLTASGSNTKARLSTEVDARARHRDLLYGGGVSVKIASRTNLVVNASQAKVAFDPGATFRGFDLRSSFNARRRAIDAGIGVELTPLTSLTIAVAREAQRFERSPSRDSDTWRVAPTFTFSQSGLLTGTASVGYRRFHTLSPDVPDYAGLVSSVAIGATVYGRNHLTASFIRDVQYSYDLATAYYLGTGGTVIWTLRLAGPFDVRGVGSRTVMDYGTAGPAAGRDATTSFGGGAGVTLSNRARLGINAEWPRRQSTRDADRNYRNRRIFASLNWGTP